MSKVIDGMLSSHMWIMVMVRRILKLGCRILNIKSDLMSEMKGTFMYFMTNGSFWTMTTRRVLISELKAYMRAVLGG